MGKYLGRITDDMEEGMREVRFWKIWKILCHWNIHTAWVHTYRTVIDEYGDRDGQRYCYCANCGKEIQ